MHVKLFLFSYCSFFLLLTFASWYEMHLFKFVNQITCVFVCFKLQHVVTKPIQRGCNFVFVRAKCRAFDPKMKLLTSIAFSSVFFQRRLKHLERKTVSTRGKRWRPPDFHLDFFSFSLRISTSYFLQFPLLCNQRWCSQSPQSGYSHLNVQN